MITADSSAASSITICGVGGMGSRLVRRLDPVPGSRFWTLDTEMPAEGGFTPGPSAVVVGRTVTRGLGCGGDLPHAQRIAEEDAESIRGQVSSGLLVVLLGGGGGAGAGMGPVVVRLAREAGAFVVAVVVEPFDFEGPLRRRNAEQCLAALQGSADLVIRVSNQAMVRLHPDSTLVHDLMRHADGHLAAVLEALVRMIQGPSLVPVGVADLERWTRGRLAHAVAAFSEASGEDRVGRLWAGLVDHPFLETPSRFAEASGVLLHLTGGQDLRLEELEWLHHQIHRHCPRAQLVVGAGSEARGSGVIRAFLLSVHHSGGLHAAPAVATPVTYATPKVSSAGRLQFEDIPSATDSQGRNVTPVPGTRASTRVRTPVEGSKEAQQQFNFVPAWTGRFDPAEGTYFRGENLDQPTFVRRDIGLN
jgi:cell division protein FtsZ